MFSFEFAGVSSTWNRLILLFVDVVFNRLQIFVILCRRCERMNPTAIRIKQLEMFRNVKKFTVFLYLRDIFLIIAAEILGWRRAGSRSGLEDSILFESRVAGGITL